MSAKETGSFPPPIPAPPPKICGGAGSCSRSGELPGPLFKPKKNKIILTADDIAKLPNYQGQYQLPPPPAENQGHFVLTIKNRRTGHRTMFFRYFAMFSGFIGRHELEPESGQCELEWVPRPSTDDVLFCTPFLLDGFMYKPLFRLGSISIRRTLAASGVRITGKRFTNARNEKGDPDDWRLMWLQKNNHSGPEAAEFADEWYEYTKIGFPIRHYQNLRKGCYNSISTNEKRSLSSSDLDCCSPELKSSFQKNSGIPQSRASQFINHFPGSRVLDNKAAMADCIRMAASKNPKAYNTGFPLSFCVPADLKSLAAHLTLTTNTSHLMQTQSPKFTDAESDELDSESHAQSKILDLWLLKPPDLGGGHGIEIVTVQELIQLVKQSLSEEEQEHINFKLAGDTRNMVIRQSSDPVDHERDLVKDQTAAKIGLRSRPLVIQKYISNPKLFDGYKHDLRLFFLVTSLDPLVIWSYPNAGIVKFCSSRYSKDPKDVKNVYVHLGNQCLNIHNPEFRQEEGVDGSGSRWSLGAWRSRMESEGFDVGLIQQKIDSLIVKVVAACQKSILHEMRAKEVVESQCYELFGIDVIVDEQGEPWLIEVNNTPGFGNNMTTDNTLFFPLIADTFTLLGLEIENTSDNIDGAKKNNDHPDIVDYFEDQLARRRHFRCVFPNSQTIAEFLPLVQIQSTEAKYLYEHVMAQSLPRKK